MPVTRAGERAAGVGALKAPPAFQTGSSDTAAAGGSAEQQSAMDRDLVDLKDNLIHRLFAAVRSALNALKLVDDHAIEIGDQVKIVENAKNIPKEMASDYSQQLLDLLHKGESLLLDFENKNAFPPE